MFVLSLSNQNKMTKNFLNLAEVWSLLVMCICSNFNDGKNTGYNSEAKEDEQREQNSW